MRKSCRILVEEALAGRIELAELGEKIDALESAAQYARENAGPEMIDDAVRRVSKDMVRDAEWAKVKRELNAWDTIQKKREGNAQIDAGMDAMKGKAALYHSIQSILTGLNTVFAGSQRSSSNIGQAISGHWYGGLEDRLVREGVHEQWKHIKPGSEFELEIARAMAHFNTKGAQGKPRASDAAIKIAQALVDLQETVRQRLNRAGADIKRADAFVASLTHEPEKLRKMGYENWKTEIENLLDWEKMDIPLDERARFLRSSYEAITTGVRKSEKLSTPEPAIHKAVGDVKVKALKSRAELLRRGFDRWSDDVSKHIDWNKYNIKTKADKKKILKQSFDGIINPRRSSKEPLSEIYSGSNNIARAISHSRLFRFKDADSWLKYNKTFGSGSLRETLLESMHTSSRQLGVMERLSANPTAMLDTLIEEASEKYRTTNPAAVEYLQAKKANLHAQLSVVTGDINIGAHSTLSQRGEWVRALITMARLGGSVISAISDILFTAGTRMYHGKTLVQAWSDAFTAPLMRLGSEERKHVARLLGVGHETALGMVMRRVSSDDLTPGKATGMLNFYFKWNLLGPWTDANKAGATMMLSNDLAEVSNVAFGRLDPAKKRLLTMYGIDEKQWDVIRAAAGVADDGRRYILPGQIDEVSGGVFTGMSKAQQTRLKDKSRENLATLYSTEADYASPTPGAREQAIMKTAGGSAIGPDSYLGQALRMFWQFKAFGVTATTKIAGRLRYGGSSRMELINMIAGGIVLGVGVVQLKEMAKGRDTRPLSFELAIAGALQSGALGLYGDFLMGEYNRYGRGAIETAAGPFMGDFGTFLENASLLARGKIHDAEGRDLISFMRGYAPFANLFYTKMALDYLLWYQLQETVNPGYVERMEKNLDNRSGQRYWNIPVVGKPSDFVEEGGFRNLFN